MGSLAELGVGSLAELGVATLGELAVETQAGLLHRGLQCPLSVVVPNLGGTHDQRVHWVVHGRAHPFEVTLGGDYRLDMRQQEGWEDEIQAVDDAAGEASERGAVPLPESTDADLRLRRGAVEEPPGARSREADPTS